jgi:hypothetical protein
MKNSLYTIFCVFLLACSSEKPAGEKAQLNQFPDKLIAIPERVQIERTIKFQKACGDTSMILTDLLAEKISYNGKLLQKNEFIKLLRDSLKKKAFVLMKPIPESAVIKNFGDTTEITYAVNYEDEYEMSFYPKMKTQLKNGLVIAHTYISPDNSVRIAKYKAICRRPSLVAKEADYDSMEDNIKENEGPVYLFSRLNYVFDSQAPADSITKNGFVVECYNTARTYGDNSESYIYISYKGKKYWALAEWVWMRHEDLMVDSTFDPPKVRLPFTQANGVINFIEVE